MCVCVCVCLNMSPLLALFFKIHQLPISSPVRAPIRTWSPTQDFHVPSQLNSLQVKSSRVESSRVNSGQVKSSQVNTVRSSRTWSPRQESQTHVSHINITVTIEIGCDVKSNHHQQKRKTPSKRLDPVSTDPFLDVMSHLRRCLQDPPR